MKIVQYTVHNHGIEVWTMQCDWCVLDFYFQFDEFEVTSAVSFI